MNDLDHLRTDLKMLGNAHRKWLEKVPILHERIRAAYAAGMKQADIAELSGYQRDNIRLICMDETKRQELRERRRKRTAERKALSGHLETPAPPKPVKRGRPKRKEV